MRSLDELDRKDASAIGLIRRLVDGADTPSILLPPSRNREASLLAVQVATDHLLGAIAYETGGILVDEGWLRLLGCGSTALPRNIADWNAERADGMCLVADDVVGGFFAINRGAFGDGSDMYYWAPDSLQWEPIGFEFDFFLRWSLTSALADFYQHLRWPNWKRDLANDLPPDHCFSFEPPLWLTERAGESDRRGTLPVAELYDLKLRSRRAG